MTFVLVRSSSLQIVMQIVCMIPRCPRSLCNLWEWITDWPLRPRPLLLLTPPTPRGSLDHVVNWPRIWESRRPVWSALCAAPHSTGRGSLIKPLHFLLFSFLYNLLPCWKKNSLDLLNWISWCPIEPGHGFLETVLDTFILVLALLCWLNCNNNQFNRPALPI